MDKFLLISLGAILGANARYWIGDWIAQRWGPSFPYGTLLVNFTGSFLLGFFLTIATDRLLIDPRWRLLITAGFFGAYTTFSTYTFESLDLIMKGQWGLGFLNIFGTLLSGLAAVALGITLGRWL